MKTTDDDLIEQYRQIHASKKYGVTGVRQQKHIAELIRQTGSKTVLDYGCGQSELIGRLEAGNDDVVGTRYDPAVPGIDKVPSDTFDFVICTDVLEHVREATVPAVIKELSVLTKGDCYIVIALRKAIEILPSGENAHVTVKDAGWWHEKLAYRFHRVHCISHQKGHEALFICSH